MTRGRVIYGLNQSLLHSATPNYIGAYSELTAGHISHLTMMVARSCGSNVAKAHGAVVHVGLGSLGLGAQDLKPDFLGPCV